MIKQIEPSNTSHTAENSLRFGLEGQAPPIEYVVSFIREYLFMYKSLTIPRKLTTEGVGHLSKASWIAFNRKLTPSEYLVTLFSKYQSMPIPTIPRPDQVASEFAVEVVNSESIKKIELPPEIRAHQLAKRNHNLRIDKDSQYQSFIAELRGIELDAIDDVEFKVAYCGMRETQAAGEPTEFIKEIRGRLAALHIDRSENE